MQKTPEKIPLRDIRLVILDLDGTMIDSVPDLDVALNGMLRDLNLPPVDVPSIRMFVGKGTQNLVRSTLSVYLDPVDAEKTMDIAMTLFYKHYRIVNGEHSTVFPRGCGRFATHERKKSAYCLRYQQTFHLHRTPAGQKAGCIPTSS